MQCLLGERVSRYYMSARSQCVCTLDATLATARALYSQMQARTFMPLSSVSLGLRPLTVPYSAARQVIWRLGLCLRRTLARRQGPVHFVCTTPGLVIYRLHLPALEIGHRQDVCWVQVLFRLHPFCATCSANLPFTIYPGRALLFHTTAYF